MIKNHKGKALLSSVVILLPILYGLFMWDQLPANMVSHWGGDGVADGTASKGFVVFALPLILLGVHWLCLLLSGLDRKSAQMNPKLITLIYGIMPVFSLLINGSIYSIALEKEWDLFQILTVVLGVMFMVMGNYMPKTTRNRTMGIKLQWTLGNDENWNKTHRLAGRIWFLGGIVVIVLAIASAKIAMMALLAMILILVAVPVAYSYALYKQHQKAGIAYEAIGDTKSEKMTQRIGAIAVPLILAAVGILMVVGDVSVSFTDTECTIAATFAQTVTVRYDSVDTLEYRESFDIGAREMGFGSPRLSVGTFKNEEFGRYTLYAYTQGEGAVILKQDGNVLVFVGKTAEETKAIYNTLLEKMQ